MIKKHIAVAHAPSLPGRLDTNTDRAIELISSAADAGAGIVILPELFLCGYDPAGIARDPVSHVIKADGEHCSRIARHAAERGIAAIVGAAIDTGAGVANAALVVAPDGTIVDVYCKAKLWGEEADVFVPGPGPVLVDLAGVRIGMSICFDAGFPEHYRTLALAGADAIACPAAFSHGEQRHRYEIYFRSRALENTLYVAVSNAVGWQGGQEMFGDSALFGPRGNEIGRVSGTFGVVSTPIDEDEITRAREDIPYLACLDKDPAQVSFMKWR